MARIWFDITAKRIDVRGYEFAAAPQDSGNRHVMSVLCWDLFRLS